MKSVGDEEDEHAIPLLGDGDSFAWADSSPSRRSSWLIPGVVGVALAVVGLLLAVFGRSLALKPIASPSAKCLVLHAEHYAAGVQLHDAGHLESAGMGDTLRRTGWSRLLASNSGCAYALRPFTSGHGYDPPTLLNLTGLPPLPPGRLCSASRVPGASCDSAMVEEGCAITIVTDNSYRQPWESLACPSAKQSLIHDWLALYPLSPPSSDPRLIVAVHYRWGDLSTHEDDPRRLTLAQIWDIVAALGAEQDQEIALTLYAEGLPTTQKPDLGIQYALESGGSIVEVTNALAAADVLLASTSGFTVLPAILSRGLIVTNAGGVKQMGLFDDQVVLLNDETLVERAWQVRDRRLGVESLGS
ncbi:hypothetical protein BCR35DRAFT_304107 [Leucosporidium creatinivorum]|uniref:Uncharacterized protein n=1 Tax=Leucosporidium creatinivorum TaxID=106004 RepID=A0A1Y2FBH6_9BASI|nr:hypothetical protein BCR35DRAFT_304107 [Leucosporidium creatinivorum]